MKRSILITVLFAFIATIAMAQPRMVRPFIDLSQYENVESLPLEKVYFYSPSDKFLPKDFVNCGDGFYMVSLPTTDSLVIKTNADCTKAIVVHKSFAVSGGLRFPMDTRFEYNIKEDERRIILWYKDNRNYCGYIYDKKEKACNYVQERKEHKRFIRWDNNRNKMPNLK